MPDDKATERASATPATPNGPVTGPRPINKQVPEQTISDECKYCAEGEPEWSLYAKCWIHRRPTLDKRCTRKTLGPCGEMATAATGSTPAVQGTLMSEAEQLAQFFHETYERLAPEFGYETRKESAKPWSEVPEKNKRLMIAVCAEVLKEKAGSTGAEPEVSLGSWAAKRSLELYYAQKDGCPNGHPSGAGKICVDCVRDALLNAVQDVQKSACETINHVAKGSTGAEPAPRPDIRCEGRE